MEEDNESIEGDADTVESVPNAPASEGLLTPNEEDVYRPPKRTNQPLYDVGACSKFVSTKANTYVIRRKEGLYAFVGLKEGEDIVFAGQALVAPLFGSMLVQGAVISSGRSIPEEIPAANVCLSFYPVFSPKTHSLLRLQSAPLDLPAITAHKNTSTLKADLIQECLQALSKYSQFESILVIREYNVSQLQYISNCIPNTKSIFRLHSHTYESDSTSRLHHLMGFEPVLKPEEGIEALNISESWDQSVTAAMRNASERPTSMINAVIGGKNVGKSSFCRYLLNRLLASYETVAYIETDLGQGEFSPAGILSLHYISQPVMGPPFSHQHLEPARGFFIGSNSPKSHPDYYLACISELVDQWKHDNVKSVEDHHEGKKKCIPLILNTHGWISGLGYNLLTRQIQKSLPTDIFSVSSSARENKNVTSSLMMDILPAYHGIMDKPTTHNVSSHRHDPRYSVLSDIYTAATHREFTLASYFHLKGMDKKYEIKPKWDFQKHLVSKVPWMIDWRQGLNSVWVIYEEVKLNELLYTLNGSLVGLIGDVVDYEKQSGPNHPLPDSNIFTPPRYHNTVNDTLPLPESITCHGLAVVRSIDPSKHAFLLLTPLPESTLKKVSGMVKGELQIPLSFFLDNGLLRSRAVAGVSWDKVPYVVRGEYEGAGANTLKVRRNIQRRSLNT
ncbi:hypothetical protein BDB01DRAFT_776703 [Pilobolus umbonatus]|nr:hypothetical protein BDB01DRAFT_776703 [Pilobolus umbonatus]